MKKNNTYSTINISSDDYRSFNRFLMTIPSGDTVVVDSITSMCKSLKELLSVTKLAKERGVILRSATENWYDTSRDGFEEFLSHLNLFNQQCVQKSTKRGIEKARQMGKIIGRKRGATVVSRVDLQKAYEDYQFNGFTAKDVCARYKISQSTLYRYIHFNKLELKQL